VSSVAERSRWRVAEYYDRRLLICKATRRCVRRRLGLEDNVWRWMSRIGGPWMRYVVDLQAGRQASRLWSKPAMIEVKEGAHARSFDWMRVY